jgi:hypothetical protein
MKRGLRKAGLGFIFQPYRDDPNLGRWESEVDETAPLLENRFQEHLETGMDEGGSIAEASAD